MLFFSLYSLGICTKFYRILVALPLSARQALHAMHVPAENNDLDYGLEIGQDSDMRDMNHGVLPPNFEMSHEGEDLQDKTSGDADGTDGADGVFVILSADQT